MMDAFCPLDDAQEQIVILRAIELRAEAADLVDQRAPDGREVAKVIVGKKEVGRPVRLKKRRVQAVLGYLVFVGIDQVGVGTCLQQFYALEDRVGLYEIVVIQQ